LTDSATSTVPRWFIPALVGGVVLVGGGILLAWLLGRGEAPPPPPPGFGDPCSEAAPCPATAPVCRDGTCQCVADRGKDCNCGGTVQCDGTCSAEACTAGTCKDGRCCVFRADPACNLEKPPPRKSDFNEYILRAIDWLHERHGGKGYYLHSAYTHDLDYARPDEIKAGSKAPATMCVAAVSEVIIVALRLYAEEHGDPSVFARIPAEHWNRGALAYLRPYVFMHEGVDSNGTADALERFGLGEQRPFPLLVRGDFINFNRTNGKGHAVVFLGFLNASGEIEREYASRKVVGFKYFSAQSGGLGYRWAYFVGHCPDRYDPARPRDCGVLLRDDQRLLHTGYMLHPSRWTTAEAKRELESRFIRRYTTRLLERQLRRAPRPGDLQRLSAPERRRIEVQARRELVQPLPGPLTRLEFDGVTTDNPPPPPPRGRLSAPP
jgi:hypothetical protein